MRIKALIATAVMLVLAAAPVSAANIFKMTEKDSTGKTVDQIEMTIDGKMLRMDLEMTAEGKFRTSMIFNGEREELMLLDHDKSEAVIIDRKSMEQVAAQLKQAREQMEQMMANVPPEQQEMMKQMMKGKMKGMMESPPPTEVVKTSKTGTTNGYPWVQYDVTQEGAKIREYLVTDWSKLDIDASTFDVFKEMANFLEGFTKGLGMNMGDVMENPFDEASGLDGFPVVTRDLEGGAVRRSTELTTVSTGDVAAGLFENPGYKVSRIDAPMR